MIADVGDGAERRSENYRARVVLRSGIGCGAEEAARRLHDDDAMSRIDTATLAATAVGDAMHQGVYSCPPEATLAEVAEIMAARNVHAVVVNGRGPRVVGLISGLDLIAAATVRDLDRQSAGGSAAGSALTVGPDDTLELAAQLMTRHGTSHLVVVDPESGRLAGVLSTLDIVNALAAV
jgi:CBS domain-containing protein